MNAFDLEIAARTVWMEARGEPTEGQRAVAHAIINRHLAGKWYSGQTLAECCLIAYQFSGWNTTDLNRRKVTIVPWGDPTLIACRGYIQDAASGTDADPTNGATHYYSDTMATPPDWISGAEMTVQIGHHIFWKNVT